MGELMIKSSMDSFKMLRDLGLIQASPVLILPLFAFITQLNQLNRCLSNEVDNTLMSELRGLFQESQNCIDIPKLDDSDFETLEDWFYWIIDNGVSSSTDRYLNVPCLILDTNI